MICGLSDYLRKLDLEAEALESAAKDQVTVTAVKQLVRANTVREIAADLRSLIDCDSGRLKATV